MALTKTYHPAVPLHSFANVAKVIEDHLSSSHTSSITITCSDVKVSVTVVQTPFKRTQHILKYVYEWQSATKEQEVPKDAGEDVERLRGDAHGGSANLPAEEAVYIPTPEEAASFAAEEDS